MTWTALVDRTTGTLITAAMWNLMMGVTGNLSETAPAKVTTAGDLVYATGPGALARLAAPAPTSLFGGAMLTHDYATNALIWSHTAQVFASGQDCVVVLSTPISRSSGSGDLYMVHSRPTFTVGTGVTVGRAAQVTLTNVSATIQGSGVLTNHNTLWLGTPANGTTVRVIDSASGAYLTTGGTWTNNPSWAALKEGIRPVADDEVRGWLDWMRSDYRPVRYRYRTDDGPRDQEYEYEHVGFLLDDMPVSVREVVCADPAGGISTKDTEGFLLALVKGLALEVAELRARVTG